MTECIRIYCPADGTPLASFQLKELTSFGSAMLVVHDLLVFCALFLIDKVCDQHIQRHIVHRQSCAACPEPAIYACFVDPVIAVHDLIIDARSHCRQSRIDGLAVTTVFLMNRPANPRIISLILDRQSPPYYLLWNRHPRSGSPPHRRPAAGTRCNYRIYAAEL